MAREDVVIKCTVCGEQIVYEDNRNGAFNFWLKHTIRHWE